MYMVITLEYTNYFKVTLNAFISKGFSIQYNSYLSKQFTVPLCYFPRPVTALTCSTDVTVSTLATTKMFHGSAYSVVIGGKNWQEVVEVQIVAALVLQLNKKMLLLQRIKYLPEAGEFHTFLVWLQELHKLFSFQILLFFICFLLLYFVNLCSFLGIAEY